MTAATADVKSDNSESDKEIWDERRHKGADCEEVLRRFAATWAMSAIRRRAHMAGKPRM